MKYSLFAGLLLSFLLGFLGYWMGNPLQAGSSKRYSSPIKVSHILNGKSFVLEDGTIVRLASLQVPNIEETDGLKRPGEPMGKEAKAFLKNLLQGKSVELRPEPALIDRKGRRVALAQLAEIHTSVQEAMLTAGMAVVYPFPDQKEALPILLAAEASARKEQKGIWTHPYWQPANAATYTHTEKERYQLVTGIVQKVASAGGNWYLNFGTDYKSDFTGFIQKSDLSQQFHDYDLRKLEGQKVTLRGWVYTRDGVMMDIVMPEQIETQ